MFIEFYRINFINGKFYVQKRKNDDFEFEASGYLEHTCRKIYKIFLSVFLENDRFNPFTCFKIKKGKFTYNKLNGHVSELLVEKVKTKRQINRNLRSVSLCADLEFFDGIVKEIISSYVGFDDFDFFIGFFFGIQDVHLVLTNVYDYYKILEFFHKEECSQHRMLHHQISVFKCSNERANHFKEKNKFIEFGVLGDDYETSVILRPHPLTKYVLDNKFYHIAVLTYYDGVNLDEGKYMSIGSFSFSSFLDLVARCMYSKGCVVITGIKLFFVEFMDINCFMKEVYGFSKKIFFSDSVGVVKKFFEQEILMVTSRKKMESNIFMLTNMLNFYKFSEWKNCDFP